MHTRWQSGPIGVYPHLSRLSNLRVGAAGILPIVPISRQSAVRGWLLIGHNIDVAGESLYGDGPYKAPKEHSPKSLRYQGL